MNAETIFDDIVRQAEVIYKSQSLLNKIRNNPEKALQLLLHYEHEIHLLKKKIAELTSK